LGTEVGYDPKYPDLAPDCPHKWGYEYEIISNVKKKARFDIYECDVCKNYKMERTDNKTKKVTVTFHDTSPKNTNYLATWVVLNPMNILNLIMKKKHCSSIQRWEIRAS
jgi:hypothetical protein